MQELRRDIRIPQCPRDDNKGNGDDWRQLGKFFYQLAVVSYAGLMVTAVVSYINSPHTLVLMGAITMFGYGLMGAMFIYISNNKNKK